MAQLAATAVGGGGAVRLVTAGAWSLVAASDRDDTWLAESDGWAAVATGVLDNRPGLAQTLGQVPDADPAMLAIHTLRSGGSFHAWRGMFAVIVTDGTRVWAARDHLGFSPLYHSINGTSAGVASRARQAAIAAGRRLRPDVEMIESTFWGTMEDETRTALDGVRRIPKMTVLEIDGDQEDSSRYWDPARLLETRSGGSESLSEEFDEIFGTAVERVLTEDSVIALSGGIDSPAVAAYAAPAFLRRYGRPLPALSAVYPDLPSVDETRYIELVAERLGLDLTTYRPMAHPLQDVTELVTLSDGPVPTVSLAESAEHYRIAASAGWGTILTGEMAEFVMALGGHTLGHLLSHGRIGAARRYLMAERSRGVTIRTLGRRAVGSVVPERLMHARRRSMGLAPQSKIDWIDHARFRNPRFIGVRRRWARHQLAAFQGAGLSVEADEAVQQSTGVRVRRPWMDVDLIELFLALPAHVKYPNGRYKGLVKKLLRERVPDEILDRRDRTYFDESFMRRLSFEEIERLISSSGYRMAGVDYHALADRIRARDVDLIEGVWLKDLAVIHAFMKEWE